MIVVLKMGADKNEVKKLIEAIGREGVEVNPIDGTELTVLGLVGDTSKIDAKRIEANKVVEKVMHVVEPFKKANRKFHPEPSIINVNGMEIGSKKIAMIAGPCSVETEDQIVSIAKDVKKSGAGFLRGGAFKPRTSPYAFQGLKYDGLDLLKELGKTNKTILLKRGLSATIEEWLMSAEYIMAGGNENVVLCERGIRTFETYTRNTLDLSAILAVKKLSHLPVIVDPSHAAGKSWMVDSLSKAAIAVGADGLIIEVHNDPAHALCDGKQSIKPNEYDELISELKTIASAVGREI